MIDRQLLAATVALSSVALAQQPSGPANTPTETIGRVYAQYEKPTQQLAPFLTEDARKGWDAVNARVEGPGFTGVAPLFSFDLVVQAQDYQVTELKLKAGKVSGGWCEVVASFKNFGEATVVRFKLRSDQGLWRIDDISGGKPGGSSLRTLMAESLK